MKKKIYFFILVLIIIFIVGLSIRYFKVNTIINNMYANQEKITNYYIEYTSYMAEQPNAVNYYELYNYGDKQILNMKDNNGQDKLKWFINYNEKSYILDLLNNTYIEQNNNEKFNLINPLYANTNNSFIENFKRCFTWKIKNDNNNYIITDNLQNFELTIDQSTYLPIKYQTESEGIKEFKIIPNKVQNSDMELFDLSTYTKQ